MAQLKPSEQNSAHTAVARALNLPVSTKHCVEICRSLRYKNVSSAKQFLEEVSTLQRAVPYKRFIQDLGHKAGMSAGRYPQKAAKEMLRLLNSVEANAQVKGLDTSNLKITRILANKASIPLTGRRHRGAAKRTHVEVEVRERFAKKREEAKKAEPAIKEIKREELKKTEPVLKSAVKEEVTEARTVQKEHPKKEILKLEEPRPIQEEEPSSAELLRRAQLKAAELKKKEKEQKETQEVSKLFNELQQKGSLRSSKGGKP